MRAILPAARWWIFLALASVVLLLLNVAHGPLNPYWLFTLGCWACLDAFWALAARHIPPAGGGRPTWLARCTSSLICVLYCLPLSSIPVVGQRILPQNVAIALLGSLMCALGVGFAIWARRILSVQWSASVTPLKGNSFVQRGPYAIVRHPIYFGFLVAAVGMVLVLGEVRAIALLFGIEILLKKMGHEESLLRAAFPGEYQLYEQRVKRIVPWVW